jgi:hypothetical protein
MNHLGFAAAMSKLHKGFFIGSGLQIDHYRLSDSLYLEPKYILTLSPYVRKSTGQWDFNIGVKLSVE